MDINSFISFLAAAVAAGTAGFVLYRDPRSFVHQTLAAGLLVLSAEAGLGGMGLYDISYLEVTDWQRWQLIPYALTPGAWLLFSLSFGRANYLEFLSRWKWIISAAFVLPLTLLVLFPEEIFPRPPSYDEYSRVFIPVGWAGNALHVASLIGAVLVMMNLERTLRHSVGHTRWQVKFLVLGAAGIFGARIYTGSQVILFSMLEVETQAVNAGALLIGCILIARALGRTRLLKFDFYLSHTILYNSVTVLLVGVYFISVAVVARLVFFLRGPQDPAVTTFLVFLAVLGLAVFLLSDRLRLERKRLISRHFKRPRYDYPRVWAGFTERTASLTSTPDLCASIVRMVSETLEILSVSIWLWEEQEEAFSLGGSTALSQAREENVKVRRKGAGEMIRALAQQNQPMDLRESADGWAADLRGFLVNSLREEKVDLCIPLSAAGQLVGIMNVGSKIGHDTYSFEDRELLKTVADQSAATLLTLRLGERLQQAREMEAFQVMSAFFMHDLKNLASRLSLVTQNLPVHFENPEFRRDALRTISQSLEKINGMCNRLSLLSQKLEVRPQETDLNEGVKSVLSSLDGLLKTRPAADLQPLPKVRLDPEQFQKVLTNLLLNANEAIGNGGSIRVSTAFQGGWAVLSIADDGCGMSGEFMDRHLFRPFQTTKKQGMGIGLFHCKKIVEAHQGRIEVESREGKGTIFRVLLPLKDRV